MKPRTKKVLQHLFVGLMTPENIPDTKVRRRIIISVYAIGAQALLYQYRAYKAEEELEELRLEQFEKELEESLNETRKNMSGVGTRLLAVDNKLEGDRLADELRRIYYGLKSNQQDS